MRSSDVLEVKEPPTPQALQKSADEELGSVELPVGPAYPV
jgi:hypothetical protein